MYLSAAFVTQLATVLKTIERRTNAQSTIISFIISKVIYLRLRNVQLGNGKLRKLSKLIFISLLSSKLKP
jgi:hypothetical protein